MRSPARTTRSALAAYRDAHAGATVVLCGCGESLNLLREPERVITIGVNDFGRHFTPDYLVVVNPRSQFNGDRFRYVEESRAKVLFTQLADLGTKHPDVVRLKLGRYGGTDFSNPEVLHYTKNSPYVALSLAIHMGARRIGLIGVDFTEHHFFGKTGVHPLARQLATIDEEYRRLRAAAEKLGVGIVNLSPHSRLTAFDKMSIDAFAESSAPPEDTAVAKREAKALKIVSYSTTPVAGVPAILARSIAARTPHTARCVWATNDYRNGVSFNGELETNYLLQRLECYEGILVVTTNADERIDRAFQRRMDVVVEFSMPDASERWGIWQLHLPTTHAIGMEDLHAAVQRCPLSGGQIRNAALHAALLAVEGGEPVSAVDLHTAIEREYRKRGAMSPLRSPMATRAS